MTAPPTAPKPGTIWTRTLFLAIAGILAGVIANALRPAGQLAWSTAWSQQITIRTEQLGFGLATAVETASRARDGSAIVLDARALEEYDTEHIPGALSMPLKTATESLAELQFFLQPDLPIITYCSGPSCDDALMLAQFLNEQGYTNLTVFVGGLTAWQEEGRP